jgi:hypothetical protein
MIIRLLVACSNPNCIDSNTVGIPNSTGSLGAAVVSFTNLGLTILGALAVIFMVVGGLQYVLSGGNSARTKQARETIIYAAVGLVVAGSAYAIVFFLSGKLGL